jgi:hypothetical protein
LERNDNRLSREPGRLTAELAVFRGALKLDPAQMAALIATPIAPPSAVIDPVSPDYPRERQPMTGS